MPVPSPSPGEDRDTFISRCIRSLHESDKNRPNEQLVAICFSQWREESIHPDFARILTTFLNWFKDGTGYQRFSDFVHKNRLDPAKAYRPSVQFSEGFQWLKPEIEYLKQDAEAKYYRLTLLTANVSMNDNDYRDWQKLRESAPSLLFKPVNYNHDHSRWLPFPRTRVELIGVEDMTVEGVLRVDNADRYFQQQLDHDPAIPNGKWINHPSAEGWRLADGHRDFAGVGFLEADGPFKGMPGDPLSEIHSLAFEEGIRDDICKIVDGKVVCEPCSVGEPPQSEVIARMSEAEKPYPNVDEFADPENRKYPIDCEHVMAAWSYINMPKNQGDYSADKWSAMKGRVKAAMNRCGHEVSEEESMVDRDKVIRLSEANLKLQGDLVSARNQFIEAQRDNANQRTEAAKLQRRIIELEALQPQLEARNQTILSQGQQLEAKDGAITDLKKQVEDLKQAHEDSLKAAQRQYEDRILEQNTRQETQIANLRAEYEGKFNEAKSNREIASNEAKRLREDNEAKDRLVLELQGQNDVLRKDRDALTSKATDSNEYARKAIKERSEVQEENAGLRDEAARLTQKNADLTDELREKSKTNFAEAKRVESLTEQLHTYEETLQKARRYLTAAWKELNKRGVVLVEDGKIVAEPRV